MINKPPYTLGDIVLVISHQTGYPEQKILPESDVVNDLGCWGDDLDELLQLYAKQFKVDISRYRWYFHSKEEGFSMGGLFVKAPNDRVQHIPITPALLLNSANAGRWLLNYPEHRLPKRRYDLLLNLLILLIFSLFCVYQCAGK